MSKVFDIDRSLLNPKFDGYKLQERAGLLPSIAPLPGQGATQSTVSNRSTSSSPLSFEEVQSRVKHNHLVAGKVNGEFAYIDAERRFVLVQVDPDTGATSFHTVTEIPDTIHSGSGADRPAAYPTPIALGPTLWVVSDGRQLLHLIELQRSGLQASIIGSFQYTVPDDPTQAALELHSATLEGEVVSAIISHRVSQPVEDTSTNRVHPHFKTVFDVIGISLPLSSASRGSVAPVQTVWRRRGDTIPRLVIQYPAAGAVLLAGASGYEIQSVTSDENQQPMDYTPTADEIASIPRAGENLDGEGTTPLDLPKPLPYSWTQTNDSVTVAFPLPSSTPSSAIRVTITAKHLTLLAPHSPSFPVPRFLQKDWWGDVDASASFWTWDKEGERQKGEGGPVTVGLLSLHLEKKNEGTRWPHVFASIGTDSADPEDVEVPETLDPSEMWHIRESLEKYTAALTEGRDASGLGLGSGIPSLGQGEYDEEVDANSGSPISLTWVPTNDQHTWEGRPWPAEASLLSNSLPIAADPVFSLVIKHDVDGAVFQPPLDLSDSTIAGHPGLLPWKHTASFSALAFVLASKRDLRFTFHIDSRVVLAFEGGNRVGDVGENVYLYYATTSESATTAPQSIVRIGGGEGGALLGVVGMVTNSGSVAVLCLCEKELVILPNVTG